MRVLAERGAPARRDRARAACCSAATASAGRTTTCCRCSASMLIADAARRVREEELAAMPLASETPPILDTTWATYIGAVDAGRSARSLGDVHSLTTRGDGGLMSSVIVGEANGIARCALRIERIDGCVLALDVVVGREIDELRGSTLTLWAIPPRAARRRIRRARRRRRCSRPATQRSTSGSRRAAARSRSRALFDDELRNRAVTTLDGWLAYWENEGAALPRVSRSRRAARSSDAALRSRDRPLGDAGRAARRRGRAARRDRRSAASSRAPRPTEPTGELEAS